jgi:hypothetical protein
MRAFELVTEVFEGVDGSTSEHKDSHRLYRTERQTLETEVNHSIRVNKSNRQNEVAVWMHTFIVSA